MDEELTRQKGLLRAPSARKDSTMKRLSAEIKEKVEEMVKQVNEANSNISSPVAEANKSRTMAIEKVTVASKDVASGNSNHGNVQIEAKGEMSLDLQPKAQVGLRNEAMNLGEGKMPDITAEAVRSERENSPQSPAQSTGAGENSPKSPTQSAGGGEEDTSSFSVVTSDSEQDSTLESPHSIEESVKPGHVKDMIAKVAYIAKGGEEEQPCRAKFSTSDDGGVEYDRVNQFVAIEKSSPGKAEALSPDDSCKSPSDPDEVYVAKSFPELAQVFEPGELKTKKRKGKSDKDKPNRSHEKQDSDKGT